MESTEIEKDLGVYVMADLKVSSQCLQAYKKASQLLGMVGRTINSKLPLILVSIYKSIVHHHLAFFSPAWSPRYKKDGELLEKIQHRFTRLFSHLRKLSYSDRLKALVLWTLEERRNRIDIIEVFKMVKGILSI